MSEECIMIIDQNCLFAFLDYLVTLLRFFSQWILAELSRLLKSLGYAEVQMKHVCITHLLFKEVTILDFFSEEYRSSFR